jgi:hypothetical protein
MTGIRRIGEELKQFDREPEVVRALLGIARSSGPKFQFTL